MISVAYRSGRIVETPRARVFPSILVGGLKCRRDPVRFVPNFPASRESTGNFHPVERMEPRSAPNTFGFSVCCVRFPCAYEQGIFLRLSGIVCSRTRQGLARSGTHPSASRQTLDGISKQVLLRSPAKGQRGSDQAFEREIGRLGTGHDRSLEFWRQACKGNDAADVAS